MKDKIKIPKDLGRKGLKVKRMVPKGLKVRKSKY